jgi:hypothetical protein
MGEIETIQITRGDPEVENATKVWPLNCERCLDRPALGWSVDGEKVLLCWDCGSSEQEERAAGAV